MQIFELNDNKNELQKFLDWHVNNADVPVFCMAQDADYTGI